MKYLHQWSQRHYKYPSFCWAWACRIKAPSIRSSRVQVRLLRSWLFGSIISIYLMQYLRGLFVAGKYHIYVGFAVLIEAQRNYLLPYSGLYEKVRQSALEELRQTLPEDDTSQLTLEQMGEKQLKSLRSVTKRKVEEVQSLRSQHLSTTPYTAAVLALGSIHYFTSPTICALAVGGYLTLLVCDYVKSLSVIRFGAEPAWRWRMGDLSFVFLCGFGAATGVVLTRAGIGRLRERASKAIAVRDSKKE